MGSSKIKSAIIAASILFSTTNLSAISFEEYQKQQQSSYTKYKDNIEEEFKAYKKAYADAFSEFKDELSKKWPDKEPDITTKKKWVEYTPNLESKKSVDFEKEELSFEVIAKNEEEAKKKIEKLFEQTLTQDVKTAVKNDIIEKKVYKKLKKKRPEVKSTQKIIADIIKAQEKQKLKKELQKQKYTKVSYNGKFIYKANVKLPANSTVRKAKQFKSDVIKYSSKEKIPAELIYAIMHSESSFNPMAKSHIPAFGLMQIVPKTAGVDSYKYLYKKKKVLSSSYLYTSQNNIKIGSAYLHILYYRYLKRIEDPQSRLYCAIAAYNTGAGNVAKAFIGSYNINKASVTINKLSSQEVYNTLIKKLPYNETRKYLKKVNDRVSAYNKLLKTTL